MSTEAYTPLSGCLAMAFRRLVTLNIKNELHTFHKLQNRPSNLMIMVSTVHTRSISSLEITKNLSLLSKEKKSNKVINLKLEKPEGKPLVVMLSWLMARRKHIYKYADLYLQHDFDVLNVSISPWQLLWPTKGTQMVAKDVLKFLDINTKYGPLILHGFSVGGYLWGEVLVNIAAERDRYAHVVDRIAGQVWDSAADITEISVGLPIAVFPRNKVMQAALRQYVVYHLKAFDKVATRHYVRSSQMFHTNLVRAPAQFFLSKTDPIGAVKSNQRAKESWESMGIQVYWKCWDRSPHVGHFRSHQKEYISTLNAFLENTNILSEKITKKVKAKL
ncbi:transmembrane protein 53 isoform X1 [Anoplophora glabripennis]|uniref:transmembrane protein 53 isoform X1 n=1 Tax=Anoplophora glabripennis TaxID=217634 RepID=UPI000875156E|nr:transmembrane protein 53 isoform X1 [Anoplophora glabripennis]